MKVLWITNTLFPDVCKYLQIDTPVVGGWMYASAKNIIEKKTNIKLAVASFYKGDEFKILEFNSITYYLLPDTRKSKTYDTKLEKYWKLVKLEFSPDIVHIHGTEIPLGFSYVKASGGHNVVVSIQGLVSVCERYYYGNLKRWDLFINITVRDIIKGDTIFSQRREIKRRGYLEKQMIKKISNVIGRTRWDKTHIWVNNPDAKYHFCNETLRDSFYLHRWDYQKCIRNSIFLSQAHYPLKGLQQIILALPYILKDYPDTIVYVAGNDFINNRGWRLNGFGKLIKSLIKKYSLESHIIFTGLLSEEEICQRFLKSNVFVCPSSIENSSNSIAEAQLLGVPCVASYVGGTEDMITNGKSGFLYRFEEEEMLAQAVCAIFADKYLAQNLSNTGREVAILRHSKELNVNKIIEIYKYIDAKV